MPLKLHDDARLAISQASGKPNPQQKHQEMECGNGGGVKHYWGAIPPPLAQGVSFPVRDDPRAGERRPAPAAGNANAGANPI